MVRARLPTLAFLVAAPLLTLRPHFDEARMRAETRVEGLIVDARTRVPLENVVVTASRSATGALDSTTTKRDGRFQFDRLSAGAISLRARRIGYQPFVTDTALRNNETLRLTLALEISAQTLESITVRERANALLYPQFDEHRRSGWGRFLTDDVLRTREHAQTADVLRAMGGVRLVRIPEGGMALASVIPPSSTLVQFIDDWRALTGQQYQYACYMQVMLDGAIVWSWGTQIPVDVENFRVANLGAVELYTSAAATPTEYGSTGSSCGTVHFWSRRR